MSQKDASELSSEHHEPAPSSLCVDCGVDCAEIGEYYMIYNFLWNTLSKENADDEICIGCLEARYNTLLGLSSYIEFDHRFFTDAKINTEPWMRRSARLKNRLGME